MVRIVSKETSCRTVKDRLRLTNARKIAPIAPMLAASVGVAIPLRIEPSTAKTKNTGGRSPFKMPINNSLLSNSILSSLLEGAS